MNTPLTWFPNEKLRVLHVKCNHCVIISSRMLDASYPMYLKKGRTGIFDKGSQYKIDFFFPFNTKRIPSEKGQDGRLK